MKTKIVTIVLIGTLLFAGCKKEPKEEIDPNSFKGTYLKYFSHDDNVFFIKGVASDVYEYGRNIKVIEDLKGNFVDKSSIFVWGSGYLSDTSIVHVATDPPRLDKITEYHDGYTLILFCYKNSTEKSGDYATLYGQCSVLKFSNGYVIGRITSYYCENGEETMLWEELQKELQELEAKKGGEE